MKHYDVFTDRLLTDEERPEAHRVMLEKLATMPTGLFDGDVDLDPEEGWLD